MRDDLGKKIADQIYDANRRVTALTPKQHDALSFVARTRHNMHSDQRSFFLTEAPSHKDFELLIGRDGTGKMNQVLLDAGLPSIGFDGDIFSGKMSDQYRREDYASDYEYELALSWGRDCARAVTERINRAIEGYLRDIDREYGTRYCPTGKRRIERESSYDKTVRKIDRQSAMLEYGSGYHKAYGRNAKNEVKNKDRARRGGAKRRLFIDMDGTLAKFRSVSALEELFEPGYFRGLEANSNILSAAKEIAREHGDEVELFVISPILRGSKTARDEKNEWLDENLPEVDMAHRIFCDTGIEKERAVPGGLRETDCLIDDYARCLKLWEPPAHGIKLVTELNTHKDWEGNSVSVQREPSDLAERIYEAALGREKVLDTKEKRLTVNVNEEKKAMAASFYEAAWEFIQSGPYGRG